jgi:hypothetical protein
MSTLHVAPSDVARKLAVMTAAEDLLAALKNLRLLQYCERAPSRHRCQACIQADEAIALAEGRKPK